MVILTACQPHPVELAREQISIGTPREDAINILNGGAWYYQPCEVNEDIATDLFFFGSHSYEGAEIVILRSKKEATTYRVVDIGGFEPYIWQKLYKSCIQRDRFED